VAYQGKTLLHRVDLLEANTIRIMVHLGIPPICESGSETEGYTPKIRVKNAGILDGERIKNSSACVWSGPPYATDREKKSGKSEFFP